MNLKELDKVWRENCPDESNGLVSKRRIPKKWTIMLNKHKRKKEQEGAQLLNNRIVAIMSEWYLLDLIPNLLYSPKSMCLTSTTP